MELYEKGENHSFVEKTMEDVIDEVRDAFPHLITEMEVRPICVKAGSKLRNLIPAAINQCKKGLTVLVGSGTAVGKVVSLSEMVSF